MKSDIQIAQECAMKPIAEIADQLGLTPQEFELRGTYKAKLPLSLLEKRKDKKNGKLILVTAITPTPAGEGKTTVTVGLGQALCRTGKSAVIAIREPSLGPVMGVKGGATGGGYSQVVPMEDINLHFTGDLHAVTAAHNLLAALIDNHLFQGNALGIDPQTITFQRAMDMNERSLRHIVIGLGGAVGGVPRESGFMITAASEVMAVLCLATDLQDLKKRLGAIVIGRTYQGEVVTASMLEAEGAMCVLLKEAFQPNLVQTLEGTPCLIHGGPFANIAHGCNSVIATKMALKLGDYVVTEAGFGSDLGAEKFLDIKCRNARLAPDALVLVATVRALKYHGGVGRDQLTAPNVSAVENGCVNLKAHMENMLLYGVPVVVAINRFATDTDAELEAVRTFCSRQGVPCAISNGFVEGGAGAEELAGCVVEACEQEHSFAPIYPLEASLCEKIEMIAKKIYHADSVSFSASATRSLEQITADGYGDLPVCIAKTQYSFSDDATLLGDPRGFVFHIREVKLSAGAGFVVALSGTVMTMPGLPKVPAANHITVDEKGVTQGIF